MSHLKPPPNLKLPRLRLLGEDGNAFVILGRWRRAAKNLGWPIESVNQVVDHAQSGDYNHLIVTVMDHCIDVGEEPEEDDTDW